VRANARRRAENLTGIIEDIRASGITSARQIAMDLNERRILTPRGGKWHASSTSRLLNRLREQGMVLTQG